MQSRVVTTSSPHPLSRTDLVLGAFALSLLTLFVLYPSIEGLKQSLLVGTDEWTLENYSKFFSPEDSASLRALGGSLYVSFLSVLFSGLVGVSLAFLLSAHRFPGHRFFAAAAVFPALLPPLVGVIAFLFLAGESGILPRGLQAMFGLAEVPFALEGVSAIVAVHVYSFLVYFYLFTSNALQTRDPSLMEAARNLGASRSYAFWRITVPEILPALGGAALLVFMASMASFSAPYIFSGTFRILSLEIFNTKLAGDIPLALSQTVMLSIFSLMFLVIIRSFFPASTRDIASKGIQQRTTALRGVGKWSAVAVGGVVSLLLVLPHLTIVLMAFVQDGTWTWQILPPEYTLDNFARLFRDKSFLEPIINSVKMSMLATAGSLALAMAAAYLIVRRKVKGRGILDFLVMISWALPGTVIAMNLIVAFNRPHFFTGGQVLVGTYVILPIAYFVRHTPIAFRAIHAAFERYDPTYEEAARNLGAGGFTVFRRVTLPLIMPGIVSGGLLCFIMSLGEFVSSIMLYNYSNRPISVEVVSHLRQFNLGSAAAYGVMLILLIGLALGLSQLFTRRMSWMSSS